MKKSWLLDKKAKFMGFAFDDHPTKHNYFLNFVIYKTENVFLMCLSEGENPRDVEQLKRSLGIEVSGRLIAPYAARFIADATFEQIQKIMKEAVPNGEWVWLCDHKDILWDEAADNFYCSNCKRGMGAKILQAELAKTGHLCKSKALRKFSQNCY